MPRMTMALLMFGLVAGVEAAPQPFPKPERKTSSDIPLALRKQLREMGVDWHELKRGKTADEWVFACELPVPGDPKTRKHYATIVRGKDAAHAVRVALETIQRERSVSYQSTPPPPPPVGVAIPAPDAPVGNAP